MNITFRMVILKMFYQRKCAFSFFGFCSWDSNFIQNDLVVKEKDIDNGYKNLEKEQKILNMTIRDFYIKSYYNSPLLILNIQSLQYTGRPSFGSNGTIVDFLQLEQSALYFASSSPT